MANLENDKIINYIKKEVENDKIIKQDFTALKDYGVEFEELNIDIKKRINNKFLEVDINIEVNTLFFNKTFLKNKNIENINFSYKNYEINIDNFIIEGSSKLSKNFNDNMEELKKQMREAEDEEKTIISNQMNKLKNKKEEQEEETKKIKREIETTLNAQLKLLKDDIEKLKSRIEETITEINKNKETKNIKDILKNFKNDRTKKATIRTFENNYSLIIYNKKLELTQLSYKIREKYFSMSLSEAHLIFQKIAEINQMKYKRITLKEEYNRLKSYKDKIKEEIENLVFDEFEALILESINEDIEEEKITISKMELYKVCFPRYKTLIKNIGVENV